MRWATDDEERDAGAAVELLRRNGSAKGVEETPEVPLPTGGRLVWMTPDGALREIEPSGFVADGDRSCPGCGADTSVATRAREHPACGHVGLDGFVVPDQGVSCPKCGDREDAFPVVARVHSCLECGRVLDRPLGTRL